MRRIGVTSACTIMATGGGRIAIRILFIITIMIPPTLIPRTATSTLAPPMRPD
jgi:hypothetical protein